VEVKRDPDYELPPKILLEPLDKNKDKYCAYHDAVGHLIEGCISLRLLIEKFISNKKLVRFLRDNLAQPRQNRDSLPRNIPPRDQRERAPSS
jgi:hypothetical protein